MSIPEIRIPRNPPPQRVSPFDQVVEKMLSGGNDPSFAPILVVIDSHLRRFRLHSIHDAQEVFNEAYRRAKAAIAEGKPMPNIPAWFRTTAFNIVREWSRQAQAQGRLQADATCLAENRQPECYSDVLDMLQAFQQLPFLEKQILILNAQGLSWKEVAQRLVEQGDCSESPNLVQNITQKACRARKILRQQQG
jgi:hypothetical protein